jgi:hypothetical protein
VAMNIHTTTAESDILYVYHVEVKQGMTQLTVSERSMVNSCYLAQTNITEQQTEDFMCTVVTVIYSVCKPVILLVICSYKL